VFFFYLVYVVLVFGSVVAVVSVADVVMHFVLVLFQRLELDMLYNTIELAMLFKKKKKKKKTKNIFLYICSERYFKVNINHCFCQVHCEFTHIRVK